MLVVVAMIVIVKVCYKAIKNKQMNILATTCTACTEGNVCDPPQSHLCVHVCLPSGYVTDGPISLSL